METVITPKNSFSLNLKELWASREIFYFLTIRDVRLRYQHAFIDALWTMLQPLITTIVLAFVLGSVTKTFSGSIPYPVFAFVGFILWNFFTSSLTKVSNSLSANRALITKAYFPRLIIPATNITVELIDFIFTFIVLLGLLLYYHVQISFPGLIFLLPCLLVTLITSFGLGLFFAALFVKYYDGRQILPFLTSVLFFLTPVIYPIRILPPHDYLWLVYLNPLVGVIETIRAVLFGTGIINWGGFALSTASSLVFFLAGLAYFKNTEKEFADLI